jgi:Ras-related protein Rab-5C
MTFFIRYHSLAPMYYRGAQAAIIVYDISSRDSFEKAKNWVSELHEKSTSDQVVAFVGNKNDLSQREITKEEGEKFASEKNLIFFETSALEGTNITPLFQTLAKKIPRNSVNSQYRVTTKLANPINQEETSSCKC